MSQLTQLTQDATNRAQRALLQGLATDVITAIAAALLLWLPDADLSSRDAWIVLGTGLVRTVLSAIASFVMRRFVDGKVPTPLPPAPQPVPNDDNPVAPLGDAGAVGVGALIQLVALVLVIVAFLAIVIGFVALKVAIILLALGVLIALIGLLATPRIDVR